MAEQYGRAIGPVHRQLRMLITCILILLPNKFFSFVVVVVTMENRRCQNFV